MNPPAVIFHKQLGDVLLLEPALAKLSAAHGQKVVLSTRLKFAPMVQLMRDVEMAGLLPPARVSEIISFSPRPRAAIKTLLTDCDSKVAIFRKSSDIQWWHRFVYVDGLPIVPDSGEYKARYLFKAMPCDETFPYRPPTLLPPPEDWLPASLPESYVLLHATSAWKRKTWPAEKWASALDSLHDAGMGPFICTSGPVDWEIALVQAIQKASRAKIINLAGKTNLKGYLALVAKAKLVLCIDCSATHLAAAFRRPSVTLFGPTNPAEWHYQSEHSSLIDAHEFTDSPDPRADVIPVDAVCDAALRLSKTAAIATRHLSTRESTPLPHLTPLTPERRRILYVYSGKAHPKNAGLDFVVRQQLKALTTAGYHVTFVSRGKYEHRNVVNMSLPLTPANLLSFLPARYYYSLQHRFFSRVGASTIRHSEFDAIIGWEGNSRALFSIGKSRNIPCLLNCPMIHAKELSTLSQPKQPVWPAIPPGYLVDEYNLATTLLTASGHAKQSFIRFGIPESKIVNITRGADISRFNRFTEEGSASRQRPFRTVFYGRACGRKGILQTLEAWNKAAIPDSELWIIGAIDEKIKGELHSKLPSNAKCFGYLKNAESLLARCDVQILPTEAEGLAKSLIEGASCGCVSLATKESGFPIVEGETGFYIDRANTDMIAEKLKFLASKSVDLETMRQASSKFVQANLTWAHFSEKFLNAVHQTIEHGS